MDTQTSLTYAANRQKHTADELRQYSGQWVAFNSDGERVVASAATLADLAALLQTSGIGTDHVVFERIEFDEDEAYFGAAELQ